MTSRRIQGLTTPMCPVPELPSLSPIWHVADTFGQTHGQVGRQFTSDASSYDTRYFHSEAFAKNYRNVVEHRDDRVPIQSVLDVACGSGNSTMALCQEYPNAHFVATDLSLDLLLILDERLTKAGLRNRVDLVWADSSSLPLEEGAFDLVVGSSMLHHMVLPRKVGTDLIKASAAHGLCVFFEPFLAGHLVLLQAIRGLLAMSETFGGIDKKILQVLETYASTIEILGDPSTDPMFRANLDDKWIFSRRFFQSLASDVGASHWIVRTNPDGEQVVDKLSAIVFAATGVVPAWPEWVGATSRMIDVLRAGELEDETLFEGGVGFIRS